MKTWKKNWEESKQRYIDWWNHKGVLLTMWEHFQDSQMMAHANIPAPAPAADDQQRCLDPVWRADYLNWYMAHSSFLADILPVANTELGPGSLAAILGCPLEGGADTIWIHQPSNFDPSAPITFDHESEGWKLHKQLLTECKQRANGNYYVGMPDLMEGLDVLASLEGTDNALMNTMMDPEGTLQRLQEINNIYFKVFDELYDIIKEDDGMAFCYFSIWGPGKVSKLQCDISTMISEEDFRTFVQPFIREQAQYLDYTLYHLDGVGAIRHLPALLEIDEIDAIQWTPGVGEPQGGNPKWYDLYKQIIDAGKSIEANWVDINEIEPLLDAVGTDGIQINCDFHTEEEVLRAQSIIDRHIH
jgi:hypothetical protein